MISVIFGTSKQDNDNPVLDPIIKALPSVENVTETSVPLESGVKLTSIFPTVWDVYRYQGSLTTPPCTEQILWSVFTQRVSISKKQVAAFKKVRDGSGNPILRNYRPVKPIQTKGRTAVYWMPVNKKLMKQETF